MTISVVIPVFHEEAIIDDAISRLEHMESAGPTEIVVVDGAPGADTLRAAGSTMIKRVVSEKGRGTQMNAGVAVAGGDIVLFLHADTELPPTAFKEIALVTATEHFVAGAFDLEIADAGWVFRMIEKTASLRSRFTRIPYGDQAIFIKRDYFLDMGGYKDLPFMEDVDLMRRVKKKGGRICFIDNKVKTSPRRWKKEGILNCTLRNWIIVLLYLFGVAPKRLAKWYS